MWRVLLVCLMTSLAFAEQHACGPRELQAQLRRTDPVFADATKLTKSLNEAGIKVECVLASKMASVLKGQKGAAQFRTDHGIFEALFAIEQDGFSTLEIVEANPQEPYKYLVRDSARSTTESLMEGKPTYFVKRGNLIFVTWDAETAEVLARFMKVP